MRSLLALPILVSAAIAPSAYAGLFQYLADDGTGNINIGPSFTAEMLWGNYYTVTDGYDTLTAIRISYGSIAVGRPIDLYLFDDPDDDGDPGNAVLVMQTSGLTAAAGPNVFTDYAISPTQVTGGFFVAASMLVTMADRPARLDPQSITGQSWLYFDDEIDTGNLGGSPFALNMNNAPFPGTWMVRAMAVPAPSALALGILIATYCPIKRRSRQTESIAAPSALQRASQAPGAHRSSVHTPPPALARYQ